MTATATRTITPNAVTFTRDLGPSANRVLVGTEYVGRVEGVDGVWVATLADGSPLEGEAYTADVYAGWYTRSGATNALLRAAGFHLA